MKNIYKSKWILLPLALVLSCATTEHQWKMARSEDTIQAYQTFLDQNPDAKFSEQARDRIEELTESAAWKQASSSNSISGYEQFLQQYPQSQNANIARSRIDVQREAERARIEEEKKEKEKKESLRVVRLYEGQQLARNAVAVIVTATRGIRSSKYSKTGNAFVIRVDENKIDSNYTEEIECLPGRHLIAFLVQFRPDNVPAGTFVLESTSLSMSSNLKAGSRYCIVFDSSNDSVDIKEIQEKRDL